MNGSTEPGAEEEMNPPAAYDVAAARAQSDRASRLIGQRMLQGWALLGETCPTADCIGIPLVRDRQGNKMCVICEGTIPTEPPRELAVEKPASAAPEPTPAAMPGPVAVRSVPPTSQPEPATAPAPAPAPHTGERPQIAGPCGPPGIPVLKPIAPAKRQAAEDNSVGPEARRLRSEKASSSTAISTTPGVQSARASLERNLEALASRLDLVSAAIESGESLDRNLREAAKLAETIRKVGKALKGI